MAQDLSAAGFALPELMTAGRWKSPRMPARYTERQAAGRGAVARYYQGGRGYRPGVAAPGSGRQREAWGAVQLRKGVPSRSGARQGPSVCHTLVADCKWEERRNMNEPPPAPTRETGESAV